MNTSKLLSLVWPVTRKKLHALVTWLGVACAAAASVAVWAGMLGIDVTKGKLGAQVAIVLMVAAGWKKAAPKVDAAIDALPIPDDEPAVAAKGAQKP